jgi:F-type H+-transporting ATPase subunit gamma
MGGVKELRLRIRSVGSIKQITRAMEMVATTKLRRYQDRALTSRPYTQEITGLVARLAALLPPEELARRPLFRRGEGERTLVLAVASNRGLCGPYNSNLGRAFEAWRAEHLGTGGGPLAFLAIGRKALNYFEKRGYDVVQFLDDPPLEQLDYRAARLTARLMVREFLSGEYREVKIVYTAFETMVRYVPTIMSFLPIEPAQPGDEGASGSDVILEPDAQTIFDSLVPTYLEVRVYNALLEAVTAEYASRRFAMKNATDAASDMQRALKGRYNRKRQETITKELLDIVGGAEALR